MNDAKDLTGSTGNGGSGGNGALRGLGIGCGVLVAVPVLVVLGFIVTYSVQRGTPEEYERVAPAAMMTRIGDVSQEAYEVLGFESAVGSGASSDFCYPGGLESMADETVEGAYSLSHSWTVDGVTETGAASALKRLHGHLKDEGWDIDSYENSAESATGLTLRASRNGPSDDGGDIRLVFDWMDHRGRFSGTVVAPCAYDPEAGAGTESATEAGSEVEPPELRPAG